MAKTHDTGKFIYTLKRQGSLHISIVQTFPTESEISAYQDPSVGWPEQLGVSLHTKLPCVFMSESDQSNGSNLPSRKRCEVTNN